MLVCNGIFDAIRGGTTVQSGIEAEYIRCVRSYVDNAIWNATNSQRNLPSLTICVQRTREEVYGFISEVVCSDVERP